MTSPRMSHLLTFLLPKGARRVVPPNAMSDSGWPYGCLVDVGRISLISIMGPSREAAFETAGLIVRESCQGLGARSISVRLYTFPPEDRCDGRDWLLVGSGPGGVDGWTLIVGAEVAFAPTALGATFPEFEMARPAPRAVER